MRHTEEYNTTTNRSVYSKLYKEYNAHCSYCKWHGPHSENDRWEWYYKEVKGSKRQASYPNWKLVSKNKKQWMKKPLIFKEDRYGVDISWPHKIRPK